MSSLFCSGPDLSGDICEICLHPEWQLSPEKPWVWAQINNHEFAQLIYNLYSTPGNSRRWIIRAIGEIIYRRDREKRNGYWVAIKLNWINHGHTVIDVSEVDWHITLGRYICSDDRLPSTAELINKRWDKWVDFDLVINPEARMRAASCIMWEFNTSPKTVSHCQLITQSEQMLNARFEAYGERRCLTKHPRFHLSQWNRNCSSTEADSDIEE